MLRVEKRPVATRLSRHADVYYNTLASDIVLCGTFTYLLAFQTAGTYWRVIPNSAETAGPSFRFRKARIFQPWSMKVQNSSKYLSGVFQYENTSCMTDITFTQNSQEKLNFVNRCHGRDGRPSRAVVPQKFESTGRKTTVVPVTATGGSPNSIDIQSIFNCHHTIRGISDSYLTRSRRLQTNLF
jgi:hypothetical protein